MAIQQQRIWLLVALLLLAALSFGCGSGGGSSSSNKVDKGFNGGSWESDFFLQDILFGRPLLDGRGAAYQVVNPASYIEADPVTGFLLPGYPKTLYPDDEIGNLWSLNLVDTSTQPFAPKIVPRNAALVVDLSQPVDPDSLHLDADGLLTALSPIQLVDKSGRSVPIQVTIAGDLLILNPLVGEKVGFPASPVVFDEFGKAIADKFGYIQIVFYSIGTNVNVLESSAGLQLGARADSLGTPQNPVRFNPGNRNLDFVSFGDLSFNGFLPDLAAPRIVREVSDTGTVTGVIFSNGYVEIEDSAADFNTTANSGDGEWAETSLTLRPGTAWEAKVRVTRNDQTHLWVDENESGFVYGDPQVGDAFVVQRVEYFEPINDFSRPETAIDPVNHPRDPDDPQDAFNSDLIYFLKFDEWDGNTWLPIDYAAGQDPDNPIAAKWRIGLQFSESMDIDSFQPFDSFYVADDIGSPTDPLLSAMRLGNMNSENRQSTIYFEPVHIDQFGLLGGDSFIGFGISATDLRLVLRTVPSDKQVEAFYESLGDPSTWPPGAGIIEDLEAQGVLGVNDLGGQPLGQPEQFFDKADPYCIINEGTPGRGAFPPAIDFKINLSCSGDPTLDDNGLIVHRFMGLPETAADPSVDPPITGVVFKDHDDHDGTHLDNEIYGPHIADINLAMSGFLAGHAVEFIEHVFDDFNPPSPSSPSYPDPISKTPFGAGTPINASNGVRFHQVYRRGEASPDVPSFAGTILDLVGLAWSPIGGNVTNTYIRNMQIAVCLSGMEIDSGLDGLHDDPDTRESGGIPHNAGTGLKEKFDSFRGEWGVYKEETPPISKSNVFDSDGDQSVRDEWVIVVGDSIDLVKFNANPVEQYTNGRPYFIDQKNLFAPKNQGSKFNYYHDYPVFDNPTENPGYGYDSSRGMAIEIRTDDNDDLAVALTNGYTFCAGIQSSQLPRFRVYCRGNTTINDPPVPRRTRIYAASDPYDVLNPPVDSQGQPDDDKSWNKAWDDMLPGTGLWGDNSRYFIIFNYAKRLSTIESPLLRVKPLNLDDPTYLSPIIDPPLDDQVPGTNLTIWFRSAVDANGTNPTAWVLPEDIHLLNDGQRPYVQFKAMFEGNIETSELPAIDTLLIPYRR